jgi:hypothetical protein
MSVNRALILGFASLALAACGGSSAKTCSVAGKTYTVGQTFKDADDCNTCSCQANGDVACTVVACLSDGGQDGAGGTDGSMDGAGHDGAAGSDGPTTDLAPHDAMGDVVDAGACTLPGTYTFGYDGGLVAYSDDATISPPDHYHHVRTRYHVDGSPTAECSPAFPACGAPDVITVLDITRDLADPDVQAAFANTTTPVYGLDQRPVDGPIFSVKRSDGRGFLVGAPCVASTNCTEIPRGVKTLADHLKQLDAQQLAGAECASVKNP